MGSLGTHYFYIIWLPLRERQYVVVLQWLGCGQDQAPKAKAKALRPNSTVNMYHFYYSKSELQLMLSLFT